MPDSLGVSSTRKMRRIELMSRLPRVVSPPALLVLALLASALPGFAPAAVATPIPCSLMQVSNPDAIPEADYAVDAISAGGVVGFPANGDPVVDVKIVPPAVTSVSPYLCGTDPTADYWADNTGGNVTLYFNREGPYFAIVTRASTLAESVAVDVDIRERAGDCVRRNAKEIPCGTPD